MSTTLKQKKKDDIPFEVRFAAMNERIEKKFKESASRPNRFAKLNIDEEPKKKTLLFSDRNLESIPTPSQPTESSRPLLESNTNNMEVSTETTDNRSDDNQPTLTNPNPKPYFLKKLHKDPVTVRPIVAPPVFYPPSWTVFYDLLWKGNPISLKTPYRL